MMRPSTDLSEVFVCLEPIDFRKGINGLAALVEAGLERNPFAAALYVFSNRRCDRVKILYWERNGFCLWQKRLEKDRFHWLKRADSRVEVITGQQLNWLLDGYDIARFRPHKSLNYSHIS
ncbi:MAG: IS66 family insertion sequence element accessory protein TnpB [Magnetococcales bacterium]|nr:IS66 family insertion sequence element accessory protein TnpB [Magnetococcales bacterium]